MVTKSKPRSQRRRKDKQDQKELKLSKAVLKRIKQSIENNEPLPWQRPWQGKATAHQNAFTGHVYTGINPFILDILGAMAYEDYRWVTYGQAKKVGAYLKDGEYGNGIDLYAPVIIKVEVEAEDGTKELKDRLIGYRSYTVWNVEQWDNLNIDPLQPDTDISFDPIVEVEQRIANMPNPAKVKHDGGDRAFYVPSTDIIHMPKRSLNVFNSTQEYYSTRLHEIAHSTGHPSRLNRDTIANSDHRKGNGYGTEELVAELTNMMVCRRLGITGTYDNSVAYLKSWYKAIEQDEKLFMTASLQAVKATKYIMGE